MITIMQKSHTVKQSEIQLTKNILIKTLGPWKLILWFRKPWSFICILSFYIYTCINLSYDDIGFKGFFFFLEVLVKHLSNGFGYTTISCYKSWRWYKSGSIHLRIISGPTSIGYRAIYTFFYQISIETKYKNSCYCKSFANRLRNFQNDKQNYAKKSSMSVHTECMCFM